MLFFFLVAPTNVRLPPSSSSPQINQPLATAYRIDQNKLFGEFAKIKFLERLLMRTISILQGNLKKSILLKKKKKYVIKSCNGAQFQPPNGSRFTQNDKETSSTLLSSTTRFSFFKSTNFSLCAFRQTNQPRLLINRTTIGGTNFPYGILVGKTNPLSSRRHRYDSNRLKRHWHFSAKYFFQLRELRLLGSLQHYATNKEVY